jgi:hypothetical protein
VNNKKRGGFSAKFTEPAGFVCLDSSWLDLDPLDLDPTAVDARGLTGQRG